MERTCKTCLDLISQKETYLVTLKSKIEPPNEYQQMFCHYEGIYEPRQYNIDFKTAKEILMKNIDKMFVKRRFERIYNAIETVNCTKYEDFFENKQIFVYGFKHKKTDQIDKYILIGCESDELFENDRLFNFWSDKFINEEIQKRNFKITGWPFMTLVERNNFS